VKEHSTHTGTDLDLPTVAQMTSDQGSVADRPIVNQR